MTPPRVTVTRNSPAGAQKRQVVVSARGRSISI